MGCQPERSAPSTYGATDVQEAAEAAATSEKASARERQGQAAPSDAVGAGAPVSAALVDQEELAPEEAARLVESDAAVPLCGVLDSISVGDADGRPVFRMHLQSGTPIAFVATGELKEELSFWNHREYIRAAPRPSAREPDFGWFRTRSFGRGCGFLNFTQFVESEFSFGTEKIFVGWYAIDDSSILLLRYGATNRGADERVGQMGLGFPKPDRVGGLLWAARRSNEISPMLVDQALSEDTDQPTGPAMLLSGPAGQQVGRIPASNGDTLRVTMSRIRPYGVWRHMPREMHALDGTHAYSHVLFYTCDYGNADHKHCGYSEEEVAFLLSESPEPPTPIYSYVPYRVDGRQLVTPDTVLFLNSSAASSP
jgi:hypothetical protein